MVSFGSFKIPFKIGILLSFTNFRAIVVQFGFKEMKFGDLQSSLEWPLTELLLVRSIQLVKYAHENCLKLLTLYSAGVPGGGGKFLKYLHN